MEARGFRDQYAQFEAKDAVIFGVSMDPAPSHRRFKDKEKLPFDLLVDPEMKIARLYDVGVANLILIKLAARVTYVIGRDGLIQKAFKSVQPNGHAGEVLSCVLPRK